MHIWIVLKVNLLTFFLSVCNVLGKVVVDLVAAVRLDVHDQDHGDEHTKDDGGVDVTGDESCTKSSSDSVQDNSPRDKERGESVIHTSQGFNGGCTTEQKHTGHNDVSEEGEHEESKVGCLSPTSIYDLTHSVCLGRNLLEGDGKDSKQEDLNGSSRCIPEWTRYAVVPGNV
mmetsp:Transcript_11228/g.16823  ORF Transcript_11228/g.16823 Transcript_11228/m.16823 type:complete len:172 (+) Transcript_11228:1525-2040(+)